MQLSPSDFSCINKPPFCPHNSLCYSSKAIKKFSEMRVGDKVEYGLSKSAYFSHS